MHGSCHKTFAGWSQTVFLRHPSSFTPIPSLPTHTMVQACHELTHAAVKQNMSYCLGNCLGKGQDYNWRSWPWFSPRTNIKHVICRLVLDMLHLCGVCRSQFRQRRCVRALSATVGCIFCFACVASLLCMVLSFIRCCVFCIVLLRFMSALCFRIHYPVCVIRCCLCFVFWSCRWRYWMCLLLWRRPHSNIAEFSQFVKNHVRGLSVAKTIKNVRDVWQL